MARAYDKKELKSLAKDWDDAGVEGDVDIADGKYQMAIEECRLILEPGKRRCAVSKVKVVAGDDVDSAVAVDVEREVGEILAVVRVARDRHRAHLVALPVGRFVPRVAAEDVDLAVAVEVGRAGRLEGRAVVDVVLFP